jgi:DNA-binding response OmpR family regulator
MSMSTETYEKKKILIIEDDELLGEIITAKLLSEGYLVLWRRDGKSAIEKAMEYKPDLILLDIVLPIVSGYEILESLHKNKQLSRIPVIIISNSKQPVEVARSLKLGVKDYLVKANLTPEEVVERVRTCFAEGPSVGVSGDKRLSLIIVEDDVFLKEILSINFSSKHSLRFASKGEEGLRFLAEKKPDAILLDIALPGIDGFTVLERIRSDVKYDDVAVIMLTNFGQENDRARALSAGADGYLVKANTDINGIMRQVQTMIDTKLQKKSGSDSVNG